MKTVKFKKILERELLNSDFKKEYNALEEEFRVAKDVIKLKKLQSKHKSDSRY